MALNEELLEKIGKVWKQCEFRQGAFIFDKEDASISFYETEYLPDRFHEAIKGLWPEQILVVDVDTEKCAPVNAQILKSLGTS